jgi:1,4-alpha-glucan branching enzyme
MASFGATLRAGGEPGSTVRVYAPNATSLKVIGDFNAWNQATGVALAPTAGGFWEDNVPVLIVDARYEFLVGRADGSVNHRLDPAARDTDHSSLDNWHNKSHVVTTTRAWQPFVMPAFDDLVIYQCHIGSFAGYRDGFIAPGGVASFNQVADKLGYIRDLGFNAIQLLPVQEFRADRSWGYNPAFYFALESAYGKPAELRAFVDACHAAGLAVLFDVVYNHISDEDSSFYHFDELADGTGDSYLGTHRTEWGMAPAFWRQGIRDFFLENIRMYLREYNGDGLRFDATRAMEAARGLGNDGWEFMQLLTFVTKQEFPGKYLIAEHLPDHESIISSAGFHATWVKEPFDQLVPALNGDDPIGRIERLANNAFGPDRAYPLSWNTITYTMGAHDECGDLENGLRGKRRFVERFGGRNNWHARAKTRMAWVINIASKGNPMMFMGGECHLDGYWHDGEDLNGDHRFDWSIAGDGTGMAMRYLVAAANQIRRDHPALRNGSFEVTHRDPRGVIAWKRWNNEGDVILVVANASESSYGGTSYGVATGQAGRWQQILCTQDAWFGGWEGAGNAFYDPFTQADGRIYVNVPKWSVTMFRLL